LEHLPAIEKPKLVRPAESSIQRHGGIAARPGRGCSWNS